MSDLSGVLIDNKDWSAPSELFTPAAQAIYLELAPCDNYQAIEDTCRTALSSMTATQHLNGNVIGTLDGDEADSICSLQPSISRPGRRGATSSRLRSAISITSCVRRTDGG